MQRGDRRTRSRSPSAVDDDLLRLVFTCCHPSLAPETRVALSLRTLCGLSTAEVARALLVSEASMAKRLTRARQKIRQAGIPTGCRPTHELPAAVGGGARHDVPGLQRGVRRDGRPRPGARTTSSTRPCGSPGCWHRLRPTTRVRSGLLALMLLQDSRRATRVDADGAAVLLGRPGPHPLGRRARSTRASPLSARGCGARRTSPTATSCRPRSPPATRSRRRTTRPTGTRSCPGTTCCSRLDDGPVVRLNQAVAVAERDGAAAGLDLVDAIDGLDGTRSGTRRGARCCDDSAGPRRRRPPTREPPSCRSTTPSGRCSGARRCPAR